MLDCLLVPGTGHALVAPRSRKGLQLISCLQNKCLYLSDKKFNGEEGETQNADLTAINVHISHEAILLVGMQKDHWAVPKPGLGSLDKAIRCAPSAR